MRLVMDGSLSGQLNRRGPGVNPDGCTTILPNPPLDPPRLGMAKKRCFTSVKATRLWFGVVPPHMREQ
jgi:hypothetical protein